MSIAEAEYIAVGGCRTQLFWMKQMVHDYGFEQDCVTMFSDNTSAINISRNHVQHLLTKHIEIRHHFICELVENKVLTLLLVNTNA